MTDGEVDYSTLSRAQLEEALTRIDRHRYPRNYQSLVKELKTRPPETQSPPEPRDLSTWVMIIGWYQIAATAYCLWLCYRTFSSERFHLADVSKLGILPVSTLVVWGATTLLTLCLLLITGVAGVLTVRRHRLGPRLSIVSFGAQAISLTLPGFSFQYVPLFGLPVFWSSARFGIRALGADITVSFGGSDPVYIAVDVLALSALAILSTFIRRGLPANNRWRGP
jgi:hypothetical protein